MAASKAFDHAQHIASGIAKKYGAAEWFLGWSADPDGHAITIRVAHGHKDRIEEPKTIDGVRVRVVEREMARPRSLTPVVHQYDGRKLPRMLG
jgi:hypothetical protein